MKNHLLNIIFTLVCVLFFMSQGLAQPVFHSVGTNADTIAKYSKFEVIADITGNFSNPYDYNQVVVFCHFVSPTGAVHVADGFYFQDYTMPQPDVLTPNGEPHWLVRFAPDEPGNWTFELFCQDITTSNSYPVQPFYCEGSPNPGFISIAQSKKLEFDNGKPFFGIGANLAWIEWGLGFTTYINWLGQMADNGANFTKLTMAPWWVELEWSETGIGNYDARQNRAWAMDRVIDQMEERGVYCQLNFMIHDELRPSNPYGWADNPYNSANGGPCGEPQDFLVHQDAKNFFKRKLRYINARWGYSPNVQSWEILSEADMTSVWESFTPQTVVWLNEMADYIASVDVQDRPVSSGFAIPQHEPEVWENSANTFTQLHLYDLLPDLAIKNYSFTQWYLEEYQKPVVIGEFALAHSPSVIIENDPDGITFHNCIWSSAFSGSLATSMSWWWDNYLIPQGLYPHFQPIRNFFDQVGPPGGNLQPEVLPTTADNNGLITIDPDFGNSMEKAPENYFIIDPSGYLKPLELNLGEVLYGYFFNSSRNPPTFNVNFTKPGEFTVKSGDVAYFSRIKISLDGVGVLEQSAFPNSTYTISVPVGEHEIKVANVSNGYMEIREYRLLNYSPRLRAFSMRDNKRAVGWIQNKKYNWEYVYPNGMPPPVTGGKIYFGNFDAGLYNLDWYDSDGNFESTVAILNEGETIEVDAPEIVWDAAFDLNFVTPIVVDFIADVTFGDAPLTVQFTDQSFTGGVQIDSRLWGFGDGNSSNQQNPVHTYTVPGIYDVSLKLVSGSYADSLTKENYITVEQPLVAGFVAGDTTVLVGELVYFTDQSLGNPTSWFWMFGDNTISTLKNPAHLYAQPGFYSVSLLIQKEGKSDIIIKNNYIEVYFPLIADFETDKTLCVTGETVQFTDLSQGNPDSWYWDFGDGGVDNIQDPDYIYDGPGIYSVKLNIASAWRMDSITKENLITVVDPLVADFEADRTFVYIGQDIQFTDLSTGGPLNWTWEFGDGSTNNGQDPVHNYLQEGNYSVKLKVANEYLGDSLEKINYITVVEPLIADFMADTTNVFVGQEVNFTDLSSGSPTFWVWDFGDTTNMIGPNIMHKYWHPGYYSVTLQITNGDSTDMEVKENYIHVFDSLIADFYAVPTEIRAGEQVHFFDISRGGATQWIWDFGETKTSPLQNPVYTYRWPGVYSVKLSIENGFDTDTLTREDYITVLPALISQIIVLPEGWSGMSTYINPLNADIEELLAPLGGEMFFSMNNSGVYWPSQNINTINNWEPYDGLIIKMTDASELIITGESYLTNVIEIIAGWNIFPVVNPCPESTDRIQNYLEDTLVLIKEIAGVKVFWPQMGITTLEQLGPGKSYYALSNFEANYQFMECEGEVDFEKSVEIEKIFNPWNGFSKTAQSHLIAFMPGALTVENISDGEYILGVFNQNGACSGIIGLNNNSGADDAYSLVAFGRDAYSTQPVGFIEGEKMNFRLYEEVSQKTYNLNFAFDDSFPDKGLFKINGISVISGTELVSETRFNRNVFIYPNPGNGIFYIDLSQFIQSVQIEILNSKGKEVKKSTFDPGAIISIDLSGQGKGIYLFRVRSGRFSAVKKVVLR